MRWGLGIGTWFCRQCKGEPSSAPLAQTSGSHEAGQGQTAPEPGGGCIPSLQGGTRVLPSPSAPSELVFREQGFGGADRVAPKGGLSRVQDSPPGWPCYRDLVQAKATGENPSFHLIPVLGVVQRAKDPAVCVAPGPEHCWL